MAKTERLYLRATPELKEKIEKQAEKENRTMSNWIESVILEKLEEKARKKAEKEYFEPEVEEFNRLMDEEGTPAFKIKRDNDD